jgi:hypothetical protein
MNARFGLVAALLALSMAPFAPARAAGEAPFLRALEQALEGRVGRIVFQTLPQGRAIAERVLGRPVRDEADLAEFAFRVGQRNAEWGFDERLYRRMRELEAEARTSQGAIDLEKLEALVAERFVVTPKSWLPTFEDEDMMDFVQTARPSRFWGARREAFLASDLRWHRPSTLAAARVRKAMDADDAIRFAMHETAQGREILNRLSRLPITDSLERDVAGPVHRSGDVVERAFASLGTSDGRALSLDLDYRLQLLSDELSYYRAGSSRADLARRIRALAERFLDVESAAGLRFKPVSGKVRGPARDRSEYLALDSG